MRLLLCISTQYPVVGKSHPRKKHAYLDRREVTSHHHSPVAFYKTLVSDVLLQACLGFFFPRLEHYPSVAITWKVELRPFDHSFSTPLFGALSNQTSHQTVDQHRHIGRALLISTISSASFCSPRTPRMLLPFVGSYDKGYTRRSTQASPTAEGCVSKTFFHTSIRSLSAYHMKLCGGTTVLELSSRGLAVHKHQSKSSWKYLSQCNSMIGDHLPWLSNPVSVSNRYMKNQPTRRIKAAF